MPTLLACATIMVAALLGVLGLNIALSRGSYVDAQLVARQTELTQRQEALHESLQASAAPSALAARASALGMVPDPQPGYLRLSDGAVLGSPSPAAGAERIPAAAGGAPSTVSTPSTTPTPGSTP